MHLPKVEEHIDFASDFWPLGATGCELAVHCVCGGFNVKDR
jgi:hypothetical protein